MIGSHIQKRMLDFLSYITKHTLIYFIYPFRQSSEEGCSASPDANRKSLDRRRLEDAHLKICILDVFKKYPGTFTSWEICTNFQETLDNCTPLCYEAFLKQYAG